MKKILFFLALSFVALKTIFCDINDQRRACLSENGLNNSTDLALLIKFLRKEPNITTDASTEEKFACALACNYHVAKRANETFYSRLDESISENDQLLDDRKKEMKETLKSCYKIAGVEELRQDT